MSAKTKSKATKKTPTAAVTHPPDTLVVFQGYTGEAPADAKLEVGTTYALGDHYPEHGVYDLYAVSAKGKRKGKALDSAAPEEFTLAGADTGDQLTVNVGDENAQPDEVPQKGKKGKAAAATEPALAAPKAAAKNKKPEPAPEPAGPVKVVTSVRDAIKLAGNDPLAAADTLFNHVEQSYFTLGGVLALIQEKDAHAQLLDAEGLPLFDAGQKGFAAYVEKHLGMKYRKAQYLAQTYRTFTDLGISESRLAGIGWSKLKEGLGYLEKGGDPDVCLKLAKENNVGGFRNAIKKQAAEDGIKLHGSSNNSHDMTAYRVVVHNDQAAVLEQALTKAAQTIGVTPPHEDKTTLGQCLMHIVNEWFTANA